MTDYQNTGPTHGSPVSTGEAVASPASPVRLFDMSKGVHIPTDYVPQVGEDAEWSDMGREGAPLPGWWIAPGLLIGLSIIIGIIIGLVRLF